MPAGIIAHDHHHEHERDRKHRQRQKRHSPVEHEQIDDRQKRRDDVCRHLREQMRQRGFHTDHLIDDDFLQLAAGGVHHRAQRKARQLGEKRLADGFENAEGGSVRNGQRAIIQRRAHQITAQRQKQPRCIRGKSRLASQQPRDQLCRREVGQNAGRRAHHSENDGRNEPPVLLFAQRPYALDGTLFFHTGFLFWLDETNLGSEKNCRSRQLGKLTAASRKSRRSPCDDTGSADGCIQWLLRGSSHGG